MRLKQLPRWHHRGRVCSLRLPCSEIAVINWGDPHIQTRDGLNYTFNGVGEYWMVMSETFELQARFVRAWNASNQPSRTGTVFGAVAAQARYQESNALASSARVHVEMPRDRVSGTTNARFTPPARHDKRVLSVSCLACQCELDDCFECVQTSNFPSAAVLSCRESNSARRH